VFDEAHEIEDVATQYFGVMISNYRIEELIRDADRVLTETGASTAFLTGQLAKLAERSREFFARFQSKEGRFVLQPLGSGLGVRRGSTASAAGDSTRLAEQLSCSGLP
jgi:ATP-dependent DNA helicase DinG